MSLEPYQVARRYATRIKYKTGLREVSGAMPPWFVGRGIGVEASKHACVCPEPEVGTGAAGVPGRPLEYQGGGPGGPGGRGGAAGGKGAGSVMRAIHGKGTGALSRLSTWRRFATRAPLRVALTWPSVLSHEFLPIEPTASRPPYQGGLQGVGRPVGEPRRRDLPYTPPWKGEDDGLLFGGSTLIGSSLNR